MTPGPAHLRARLQDGRLPVARAAVRLPQAAMASPNTFVAELYRVTLRRHVGPASGLKVNGGRMLED